MGKRAKVLMGIAAFTLAVAIVWWLAWSMTQLHGWTAWPIGMTVFAVLYGAASLCIMGAAGLFDGDTQ